MPLWCCANWKFRPRASKSNRGRNDNIKGHPDDTKISDQKPSSKDDDSDTKCDQVINEEIGIEEVSETRSARRLSEHFSLSQNNTLSKSVLHRSLLFDDDFERKEIKISNTHTKKPLDCTARRSSLFIFRSADDVIITPFAQILASLRKVRANFVLITNGGGANDKRPKTEEETSRNNDVVIKNDDSTKSIAKEALNELEWCLDRLENIQTHRSVSDMASTKFKQIINRELSQYAETSKSGHQISDYICKTFLDSPLDDNIQEASAEEREIEMSDEFRRNELSKYGPKFTKVQTEPILEKRKDCDTFFNKKSDPETEMNINIQLKEDFLPILGVDVPNEEETIEIINQNLLKWGMDLFNFTTLTAGHSLAVISFAIFKHHNLINKFQINTKIFVQFLIRVEGSYRSTVPYHNSIHAADVTQSANVLLNGPALDNVFSDLEILSVIFACIVHDMDHPGVTNQYLVNTNSELATLYNDSSVLENHHLAMAFTLLANKECDFLITLSRRQKQSMRRMVIDMVLATDMSKHMTLLADLKTMVETKKVAGSGILSLDTYTDRIQILQNLVHCSDLSNPTKPLLLYQIWTERIMEEFFIQGDKERENDLEISPMCDRQTATIEKSQVSFIDFIVHPLWETWSELVYPDSQGYIDTLEENREWYFNMSQEKGIISQD